MMKKVLILMLMLSMASMANATVVDLVAVDVGSSGGRLGSSTADLLLTGDVIGLKVVLNYNDAWPTAGYDGYLLSNFDFNLTVTGNGSLTYEWTKGSTEGDGDTVYGNVAFSPFGYNGLNTSGAAQVAGVASPALNAELGAQDVFWGIYLTCGGDGNVDIDLGLNAQSSYSVDSKKTPASDTYSGWVLMVEADLGDLLVKQVPEPVTIALLGLGGLFLRRRKIA